ncbi:hypothetical protein GN956_G23207 [Arapaima gigas]
MIRAKAVLCHPRSPWPQRPGGSGTCRRPAAVSAEREKRLHPASLRRCRKGCDETLRRPPDKRQKGNVIFTMISHQEAWVSRNTAAPLTRRRLRRCPERRATAVRILTPEESADIVLAWRRPQTHLLTVEPSPGPRSASYSSSPPAEGKGAEIWLQHCGPPGGESKAISSGSSPYICS